MKKTLLLLLFPLFWSTLFGQQKEEAKKLIDEGIAYHDKGDYEGAIEKYNNALNLDEDNLYALAEKAMSLMYLQKYDEAIENCQKALEKHQGNKALKSVYVTYGNAYDGLKKPEKSLEIYNEGIALFPDFFLLHYNKGITLSGIKRMDEAIISFQKSASLNPKHASSQNALGRLLSASDKRIPAILAFSRFLILEPQTKRAKENLGFMLGIMKANVEQTGEDKFNINVNPAMLIDTIADGKAVENSFTSTDLILSLDAALDYDKKNKHKTEVENFIRKFETICASLEETQGNNYGFYWAYYVPYFIEMKDKNFIETFAYIAFATSGNPDVEKWLKAHKKEIDTFYEWSDQYTWPTE